MVPKSIVRWTTAVSAAVVMTGCTIHPKGEREERQAAWTAGAPYQRHYADRQTPVLPEHPNANDLVHFALLTNADVEQSYWQWRSALEQVPIDGTEPTNFAISGSLGVTRGSTSLSQATLGPGTDPMTDIVLPNKLSAAARRSLETARAAGKRFRQAQLDLRAKVISAYDDYALSAELIRLGKQNTSLLETVVFDAQGRNRAGAAGQQDVLKADNELDLARNDVVSNESQLQSQRAALNAMLNRPADAALPEPPALPPRRDIAQTDAELLAMIPRQNPQLGALADDANARRVSIEVAKLLFEPDITLGAATDLKGIAQTFSGVLTVPILKYEAIHAAIQQAEANLRAAEASRRQMGHDLSAQAVADLATFRDADRQLALYKSSLLPRTRQIVVVSRSAYESGNGSLLDLLDAQRSLIDVQKMVANLQATRDKRVVDVQSLAGITLDGGSSARVTQPAP